MKTNKCTCEEKSTFKSENKSKFPLCTDVKVALEHVAVELSRYAEKKLCCSKLESIMAWLIPWDIGRRRKMGEGRNSKLDLVGIHVSQPFT